MQMTQASLLFIGGLATLASIGMFLDFADRWTQLVVVFLASLLWGVFGLSAFDVIVPNTAYSSQGTALLPMVYLGIGLAMIIGLYGLYDLLAGISAEARESNIDDMF